MAALDLPADRLVTCYQVHSPEVVVVDQPWLREESPRADAMVTRRRGLALGILTADCVPILFADPEAAVIGAAHAGWRGALNGVIDATLQAMLQLGAVPQRIRAAIGPCIAQRSYEVGLEFPAPFLAAQPGNDDFFAPARRAGHFLFDLPGYVERRLGDHGIGIIQRAPCDTVAETTRFFSYRRACLAGESEYGRGLSAIVLED
jgi:YfiH family protein